MTKELDQKLSALRTQHSHRLPDEAALKNIHTIRQSFLDLSVLMEAILPAGREKALVQTRLDEARMWACNAAVSGGLVKEQLIINIPIEAQC